jgi:hypothetical protein
MRAAASVMLSLKCTLLASAWPLLVRDVRSWECVCVCVCVCGAHHLGASNAADVRCVCAAALCRRTRVALPSFSRLAPCCTRRSTSQQERARGRSREARLTSPDLGSLLLLFLHYCSPALPLPLGARRTARGGSGAARGCVRASGLWFVGCFCFSCGGVLQIKSLRYRRVHCIVTRAHLNVVLPS